MRRGFTLIELLAVIVILAIIALIATPIVLEIINNSKNSAMLMNAENYLDAVIQGIVKKSMSTGGSFFPNTCVVVEDGELLCDNEDVLKIEVKGEKPNSGTMTFVDGIARNVNLLYQGTRITMNNEGQFVLGDSAEYSICELVSGYSNAIGSKYQCEVKHKTKYYFYVLSYNQDGTTNLIMDRNICADGTVATSINTCLVAWNSSGMNSGGPIDAISYLKESTKSWEYIPNLDMIYDDEGKNFSELKITGKARMPRYDEVFGTGKCLPSFDENNNEYGSCPLWLSNYLNNSKYYIQENGRVDINGVWGYWMLSSGANSTTGAWHVHYVGDLGVFDVNSSDHLGIRPVITLKI